MNDVSVIDRFLDVFSRYIDSGFGLLGGEVAFLTATLVAIDMTLAGLFWAMGHASGQGDDVMARLIKKVLYVGAFAYILGNFNRLAGIVFNSFASLGLTASGSGLSQGQLLQPGRLAQVGIDAGRPIMAQLSDLTGFPEVFANLDVIAVLFLAWLVLIVCFFVLAVQLFVTLIEFKLTTLAGFVLVPFALWNKTSFLAEKVLGNVISSGIKVLVLAVIVGIGTGLFSEFTVAPGADPSIDHALVIMLAALAMLGLGIFGPGIATGLVSGAPQLGAGAAAGTAIAAAGLAVAGGAAVAGAGSAVAAGARMAPGAARAAIGGGAAAARSASALASGAKGAYQAGAAASGGGAVRAAGAGVAHVAKAGAAAVGQRIASGAKAVKDRAVNFVADTAAPATASAASAEVEASPASASEPAWAQRMRRKQQATHAAMTTAHVLRSGDHAGGGTGPSLRDDSSS
ncbi:MAG: P-type conjugative transfer protein TrbL [Hydrogenophaga sp.]|uniref:P-type conjugative transfer protein TrbL n=2 Tax=Comamonadaceae TaxID=80864 RepID=A0ABT5RS33_9BURK|nr:MULTISPECIES: P-type conjugative transfer protein TrbL [Comamonadaceae]MCM2337372.1 P-type conjugative transfer protein TrbL [Lysobacter sp.]MDD2176510.1 P-type conjugative transfer protein TrbL [Acidovorax benzenivorans]MDD5000121.1 P-type conjugative transfer protein TrbL [Thiomonas arsenitoxydans]WCT24052.1 P-type conjugative transfer protein TrbL [Acidovorax temperans]